MTTLSASWEVVPPDQARRSEVMQLTGPGDVEVLLEKLSDALADDAYVDDVTIANRDESPVMTLAVRGTWVYLTWADDEFYGAPAGDVQSRQASGHHNPTYFAGTGISREVAASVLGQWLATGRRPEVVNWLHDDMLLPRSR